MARKYYLWTALILLAIFVLFTACSHLGGQEQVDSTYANMTWELIRGNNNTEGSVMTNLNLMTTFGEDNVHIKWTSSHPDIIAENGRVRRPGESSEMVTLTAAISKGNVTKVKTFELKVVHLNLTVGEIGKAIQTRYPTKDWVVSDFMVTDYGARATPGFDNRESFQSAIEAAYRAGGGVVYIPAGNYEFRSTQQTTRVVRVQGKDGSVRNQSNRFSFVLSLPQGVQLRGDWADPEKNGGRVLGTILEVRTGANSEGYDATVESWSDEFNAFAYTSVADRFIEMNESTGVTNLSIWYPEQNINNVAKYPWTLYQASGDSATVENVTLVNSYNGFYSAPSELHYVLNSYMTALNTGIEIHVCTDIGRIENVKISPKYWANSGLSGAPSLAAVRAYTLANGTGYKMHRSDWEYVAYLNVSGYNIGMWIGREPGFHHSPNAQFYGIQTDDCNTGFYVQDVNPFGLLISNSVIGGRTAVYFDEFFRNCVQFNGVNFSGPIVTSSGRGGIISFENCIFNSDANTNAIQLNNGSVLLSQSSFSRQSGHVYLGRNARSFRSINSGFGPVEHNRTLTVTDESTSKNTEVLTGAQYVFESIPHNIRTDISVHPRPASNNMLKLDVHKATGRNNNRPAVDVSAEIQVSLDALAQAGGGTLYLPAGRYMVNNPIVIPKGVELRGTWEVQHHTQGGGTAIFTNYDGSLPSENNASLIQLQEGSGIRGINVVQVNMLEGGFNIANPRRTPFLIQGQGPDVYIINISIPLGDRGIDLFTHNTSRHYVDYFAGALMRAGIWAGGGADGGYIRNMQFNPHYAIRLPHGGQGYPNPGGNNAFYPFIQSNCSSLRCGDVKNQTIFNNFVFGGVYGIHFVKDSISGNYPGEMFVIGHGSDGCTFSLYVDEAGPNTRIVAINSELVTTPTPDQPVRAYIRVGDTPNTRKVDPNAQLILYNSSFWGNPVTGAIINNGIVRFHQTNFSQVGYPGIDVWGGSAHVYTSYFAQGKTGTGDNAHARLHGEGKSIELSNNIYNSRRPGVNSARSGGSVYGADL
jgi:hypothetical protein